MQLQPLLDNLTDGMANKTILYEVHNGLGARRKLYHQQQLPEIGHQKQLLMQDFNNLKGAKGVNDLRIRKQDVERITSLFAKLSEPNSEE